MFEPIPFMTRFYFFEGFEEFSFTKGNSFYIWNKYFLYYYVTFCGFKKLAVFITNVNDVNQTSINHKFVRGALYRHFCLTRITSGISCAIFHHTLRLCPRSRTFLFVVKSYLQVVRLPCSILLFLLSPSCVLSSNA